MNCTLFSDILKTFNSALPVLEQSPYDFFIKHNVFLCFVPIIIRFISVTQA